MAIKNKIPAGALSLLWMLENTQLVVILVPVMVKWRNGSKELSQCGIGVSGQGKKRFFIPLVHWMSNVQILVVRKLNLLVQRFVQFLLQLHVDFMAY